MGKKKSCPLSYKHQIICSQVVPQQSLLPFHLATQKSTNSKHKKAPFLTTLPLKEIITAKNELH